MIGIAYAAVVKPGLVSQAASDRASMAVKGVGCGLILLLQSGRLGRRLGLGQEAITETDFSLKNSSRAPNPD